MLLNGIYLEKTRGCYNVPLSKINKSVVTVRRGHFMNSVFVNPGIYFYAVDAFYGNLYAFVSSIFIKSTY